jgi:hypothetical protein
MQALTFWKTITMDTQNLLERLMDILAKHEINYCVIGGQAINAYVEPLVSLDLDIVIATNQLKEATYLLEQNFTAQQFEHSLNISLTGSDLRVQIQLDQRYASFPDHAEIREVLGLSMSVASLDDLLQGKIWAIKDANRRASKRQKDLADIARLLESYPYLQEKVPEDILNHLI